jgi:hypothetical protein
MKQSKKVRQQLLRKKTPDIMFEDKSDKILQGAFFVSICLVIWGILIYRLTIINFNYLFGVVVVGTIIALYLINRFLKSSYSKFWIFFISSVVGGGTLYFGLLFLNQIFADKKIISREFPIIETGNLGRGKKSNCSQPYAVVDFNGTEKQLVFYCEFEKTIMNYTKVKLTYSKGLFGFDIVDSKELIK